MPGYRAHISFGALLYVCIIVLLRVDSIRSYSVLFEWLLCIIAGTLFPDIDIKSKGRKYFYRLLSILAYLMVINGNKILLLLLGLLALVPLVVRHRGVFHNSLCILLGAGASWVIITTYIPGCEVSCAYDLGFFVLGAWSHLLLDGGTRLFLRPFK